MCMHRAIALCCRVEKRRPVVYNKEKQYTEAAVKKQFGMLAAVFFLAAILTSTAFAENREAVDITAKVTLTAEGFSSTDRMTDGQASVGAVCVGEGILTLQTTEEIGSLYVKFNTAPDAWTVACGGEMLSCGGYGFYHEFVELPEAFSTGAPLVLSFPANTDISEITLYSAGEVAGDVQRWRPPCEEVELLLFSAHSDDDQLYFAGLLPYYNAHGYDTQIVYLTNHPGNLVRRHEALDGLWTAGCRYYPIFGEFADFRLDDYKQTVAEYARLGTPYEMMESFVISAIRRTKPLVVVTHDVDGEYGHGMHLVLSDIVQGAVQKAGAADVYAESAEAYGVWRVPKTYLHLYKDGTLTLPIDAPLSYFGGRSAFQVSQDAFRYHKSQHWMMFYEWLYGTHGEITKAAQIREYNPAVYGLYASEVGADSVGTDMFENLDAYLWERSGQGMAAESLEKELSAVKDTLAQSEAARSAFSRENASLRAKNESLADALAEETARYALLEGRYMCACTACAILGGVLLVFCLLGMVLAMIFLIARKKKSR